MVGLSAGCPSAEALVDHVHAVDHVVALLAAVTNSRTCCWYRPALTATVYKFLGLFSLSFI